MTCPVCLIVTRAVEEVPEAERTAAAAICGMAIMLVHGAENMCARACPRHHAAFARIVAGVARATTVAVNAEGGAS